MNDMKKAPFYLDTEAAEWVETTLRTMSLEEMIGQLFCPIGYSTDEGYLQNELLDRHIGGLFFRDGASEEMQNTFRFAQEHTKIPLLIPSNLEAGGDGAATDGTAYGKQMSIAASGKEEYAYRLGKIACSEAAALGINWAFAPVVDIDMNDHNPITNVRTYGSNPDHVVRYASQYIKAAKEEGIIPTLKHFPGDGVDERDQHLLTSVNSLSVEEWERSYGNIYRKMIALDVPAVMIGHIALPAYEEYFGIHGEDQYRPASLSPILLKELLRKRLGFNGLIITDASPMVGFCAAMDRETAVPYSIECGCDMFLFNRDLAEDYDFMCKGYQTGILSRERLMEANRRILSLKASIGLQIRQKAGTLVPKRNALEILNCHEHKKWTQELADDSITLVKDTQKLLPVSTQKHKHILLEVLGNFPSKERVMNTAKRRLEQEGFCVTTYEPEDFSTGVDNVSVIKQKYDLVIYLGNVENASNQTTNRIQWHTFFGLGNNIPWFVHETDALFISLANPYHLLDVPMIKTYINCYSNHDVMIETVIEKILGRSEFKGISPIDPFCGREELRY
ncbi:MAG: glycoside hydrolase family 3 N-terminal domain-containing protein [bacterium]|nr:glycoside hydrolase family 3 N-terminal domain-containing protein [bacterium]